LTREGAENAMANLFNKLMLKGQKYKMMWGRVQNDNKKEEEEEIPRSDKVSIDYKTECPLFDSSNYNPIALTESISTKHIPTGNSYDFSNKAYYPSMDPNALGGLLKKNKNKVIQRTIEHSAEEVKEIK
jgi:hypothetical protein